MVLSKATFEILSKLRDEDLDTFDEHDRALFTQVVETPLHDLLTDHVWPNLPVQITRQMHLAYRPTEEVLACKPVARKRKPKHNSYYWGALCLNGAPQPTADAQLRTSIYPEYIEFGFCFGRFCPAKRKEQFLSGCRQLYNSYQMYAEMIDFWEENLPAARVFCSRVPWPGMPINALYELREEDAYYDGIDDEEREYIFDWDSRFEGLVKAELKHIHRYCPMISSATGGTLGLSGTGITNQITHTFKTLFPFVLLATAYDPVASICTYLQHLHSA